MNADPFAGIPDTGDSEHAGTVLETSQERAARIARIAAGAERRRVSLATRPAPGSVRDLEARNPAWW